MTHDEKKHYEMAWQLPHEEARGRAARARFEQEPDPTKAENKRLRRAFHAAIGKPMGVVPAGYEDLYHPDATKQEEAK